MTELVDRLPFVAGRYTQNVDLAPFMWFRVGGKAEVLFKPKDTQDLRKFLAECPEDIPVTVLGVGSNVIVRDGGIPGVTIRLMRGFSGITLDPEGQTVIAGAGALDRTVSLRAAETGISRLEFLSGIPGSIGGALRMNAGAYGAEIKDILLWARAVDRSGKEHTLSAKDMGLSYRHCDVDPSWIFTEAKLQGGSDKVQSIRNRIAEIDAKRHATQPVNARTGGSTFANPEGTSAWKLIEAAGCRGLRKGEAQMSELHCNFMLNLGSASAADLEELGEEVRARVKAFSGQELRWEIKRLGVTALTSPSVPPQTPEAEKTPLPK